MLCGVARKKTKQNKILCLWILMWEFWSHAKQTIMALKKQNENHVEGKKGQDTV